MNASALQAERETFSVEKNAQSVDQMNAKEVRAVVVGLVAGLAIWTGIIAAFVLN